MNKEEGKYPLSGIIGGLKVVGLEFGKLIFILGVGGTLLVLLATNVIFWNNMGYWNIIRWFVEVNKERLGNTYLVKMVLQE